MKYKKHTLMTVLTALFLFMISSRTYAIVFTLSDQALLLLDTNYDVGYYPKMTATVIDKRDIAGAGIEFDIKYFGNNTPDNTMYWSSSIGKGQGLLAGINISGFDAFGLEFKILSINGSSAPGAEGPIIVGSLINQKTSSYAYHPETIGLANEPSKSAISITTTDADIIETIGFVSNIPSWWYNAQNPNPWNPNGSIVTLLVKPLAGATVVTPEPATLLLLGLGGLFLKRKK